MKYGFLNDGEQSTLLRWHEWLDDNRGDRARLRRAERAEDILLTNAFFHFLQWMPDSWHEEKRILTRAAVAGLVSHIKEDRCIKSDGYQPRDKSGPMNIASFAELLAYPIKGEPPVSELRFQQLQKSRTTDEFYRRMLRVIRLLDGHVNIASMASDIIHWHAEFNHNADREPGNRLAVRWASDYFITHNKPSKGDK